MRKNLQEVLSNEMYEILPLNYKFLKVDERKGLYLSDNKFKSVPYQSRDISPKIYWKAISRIVI